MIPAALLLALSLQTSSGFVVLDAEEGTRVFLGKRLLGTVPLGRTRVPAGDLELTLERDGARRVIEVRVEPNATRYLRIGPKRAGYEGQRAMTKAGYCRRNPHVVGASDMFDRLEFDRVARRLQRAIEAPSNCPADVVRIYELKGYVDAINGERERAKRALEIVRVLDPEFALAPDAPRKIVEIWEAAPKESKLLLRVAPPVVKDGWIRIEGSTEDTLVLGDHIRVFLWVADGGAPITRRAELTPDGRFATAVPAAAGGGAIDVVLADRWGGALRTHRAR